MNNNITFNLIGGGKINVPKREVYGFYKDFISGDHIVQIKDEEYKVRDSLVEIQYLLDIRK